MKYEVLLRAWIFVFFSTAARKALDGDGGKDNGERASVTVLPHAPARRKPMPIFEKVVMLAQ